MNNNIGRNSGDIVLVVDDVPQSLTALFTELEHEGYSVLVASDGAAALRRLDLVTPDAILMDALMPGLDGFETCRRILAHTAWRHIPVIFMTGLSDTGDVVKGFEAGGVDYVVKPVRAQEVLVRLATHVRNARAARMAREAVDVGGHGVLLVDAHQRLAWQSPQAQRWLAQFFPRATAENGCIAWLYPLHASISTLPPHSNPADPVDPVDPATAATAATATTATTATTNGSDETADDLRQVSGPQGTLTARRIGSAGLGEEMWLLSMRPPDERSPSSPLSPASQQPWPSRLATASLTPRETEVLSWIAKGKTNRDVGEILGMSPRTVNKHLEHVFEKLGVETRAAAAALASRELSADS